MYLCVCALNKTYKTDQRKCGMYFTIPSLALSIRDKGRPFAVLPWSKVTR